MDVSHSALNYLSAEWNLEGYCKKGTPLTASPAFLNFFIKVCIVVQYIVVDDFNGSVFGADTF